MNCQHYLLEDAGVAVTCIMFESALDHSVLIKLQLSVVCVCVFFYLHAYVHDWAVSYMYSPPLTLHNLIANIKES